MRVSYGYRAELIETALNVQHASAARLLNKTSRASAAPAHHPFLQVAIKRVLQDKRFKNRELQIMKQLNHTNVVALKDHFLQSSDKVREDGKVEEETYLNLVLEYVPDTVAKVIRLHTKARTLPSMLTVKLYVYQMCRSLAYLHACGICHRDIKPQNLLVDSKNYILKLCDFGSAKALIPGEPSVAYICSRYYRAPELIFGATEYTVSTFFRSARALRMDHLHHHNTSSCAAICLSLSRAQPPQELLFFHS